MVYGIPNTSTVQTEYSIRNDNNNQSAQSTEESVTRAYLLEKLVKEGYIPKISLYRIIKNSKYDIEESMVESGPVEPNDDNNSTEQTTVQVTSTG